MNKVFGKPAPTSELMDVKGKMTDTMIEWEVKSTLAELTAQDITSLRKRGISLLPHSLRRCRTIKTLMAKGKTIPQIVIQHKGQKGYSLSSVKHIHAALSDAAKKERKQGAK